ncbi:chromosomal replication initiator protein DnaA [Desulforhopalus singaporensis]|uniref:Chromosomal replication initiator protein DnaA n=1 Tax=Desulforhopalus singaporensis TaxID=91360 RepID=A0A1H0JVR2_9BACT|nr:chromosomal replication initiator protein DnaA [Desulforhopalus singaporensis]SDO47717.1 chromosomal replication initiator protein DnaA [Desulforhopalus singaporensis]
MIWNNVKEALKSSLSDNIYQLWIEPLEFAESQGKQFYISSPDRYFSAYVKQNFGSAIEEKLQENGIDNANVIFCEGRQQVPVVSTAVAKKKKSPKVQMRLPNIPVGGSRVRNLHPKYTFEEFAVGESNILAESACRSMVGDSELVGPCLYINSDTGLGKSHLTHAVAHQVLRESPMTRLHYLTAKQFAAEMVQGIKTRTMDEFKRKYQEHCDILLVEDIHSLTGKKKTQEELNDILDFLINTGKRVIVTSNSAPGELVGIDNEFRSRMTSGLVTTINAPDSSTRRRIVERKAVQHQLNLGEDLVDYLVSHVRGDVRKIDSAVIAVRAKAQLTGGYIDMDLVREVVASVVGQNLNLTAAMICDLVSRQFKVSVKELQSKSRKKIVTVPRQIAMYLSRKHTEDSLADIGKLFNRDHSTVLHSIKVVTNKLIRDTSVNAQLEILDDKVKQL